jgi:hypothetical protein
MRITVVSQIGLALALIVPARGDGKGTFTAHDIDTTNNQEAYDLKAVALDGDGRLDLILGSRETRNAVWYRNRKTK